MDIRNRGLDDLGEDQGPRRRKGPAEIADLSEEGLYKELQRLRGLVDVIEGDKKGSYFFNTNEMMSTIFGLVFVVILSVTIYAFYNLFRAISRRFFQELQ